MKRPSWDEYFMSIARAAATRSTCPRRRVGCVIANNKSLLATGYNGSIAGAPHCDDVGCNMEEGHCIATVHAEANAIASAAKSGSKIQYSVAYVTSNPCLSCFKLLVNAGIKRIVYDEMYRPVDYMALGLNANQMPEIVMLKKPGTNTEI